MLAELGMCDEVLADVTAAIAAIPARPSLRMNRGNPLEQLDRLDDALADCTAALALEPDDPYDRRTRAHLPPRPVRRGDRRRRCRDPHPAGLPAHARGS
jgi:hypothetical protein